MLWSGGDSKLQQCKVFIINIHVLDCGFTTQSCCNNSKYIIVYNNSSQ